MNTHWRQDCPEIRQLPVRPEMPVAPPSSFDEGISEDTEEIKERGDPTTSTIPGDHKPEIEEDFTPDLEDNEDKGDEQQPPIEPRLH